jgi:hypothetical protein
VTDGNTETEPGTDDDDQETVELAEKQPSKFHTTVMLEVCSHSFAFLSPTYNKLCRGHLVKRQQVLLAHLPQGV